MLIDPDKPPAFCKILQSTETFINKMQLPSCFIKENKKMLTKICLLKTDVAEMWWEAKIVREKPNYFICEGDWPQFVLHHQLKQGDILLFFLVKKSTFHVLPYTKKCCKNIVHERQVLYEKLSSSSEEETTEPSKRARKIVASDTEKRSVGMSSSDESKHEDDPHYNNPKRTNASLVMINKFHGSPFWNTSTDIPQPIFYQTISSSYELCRLRIPEVFANKYCKDMLNPVFLEAPHGKAWEVEVERSQDQICLVKGWKEFSNYYSISIGHFLMFRYNARAHFDVTIADRNAVEIEYPVESDGSLDILDHSAENLTHGPLAEKRKRKRQEGEEENDIPINIQTNATVIEEEENDIPVNLQINANVTEEEEDDILVNLQTNANVIEEELSQEISEGGKELEQQPNIGTDKEVGEANSGSEEDGPKNSSRHSLVNFNCDDPYFEIVIKKTHTNFMTIPMRFAARTNIFDLKNMRLVNEKGKEWGVEIEHKGHAVRIKRGWAEFRRQNKIASGETCRFKLIQGHAANVLQVHKIPTPRSLQHY